MIKPGGVLMSVRLQPLPPFLHAGPDAGQKNAYQIMQRSAKWARHGWRQNVLSDNNSAS